MSKFTVFSLFVLICLFGYSTAHLEARLASSPLMHDVMHRCRHAGTELAFKYCLKKSTKHVKNAVSEQADTIQSTAEQVYGNSLTDTKMPAVMYGRHGPSALNQNQIENLVKPVSHAHISKYLRSLWNMPPKQEAKN